jgi:hypothetical protein
LRELFKTIESRYALSTEIFILLTRAVRPQIPALPHLAACRVQRQSLKHLAREAELRGRRLTALTGSITTRKIAPKLLICNGLFVMAP